MSDRGDCDRAAWIGDSWNRHETTEKLGDPVLYQRTRGRETRRGATDRAHEFCDDDVCVLSEFSDASPAVCLAVCATGPLWQRCCCRNHRSRALGSSIASSLCLRGAVEPFGDAGRRQSGSHPSWASHALHLQVATSTGLLYVWVAHGLDAVASGTAGSLHRRVENRHRRTVAVVSAPLGNCRC